MPYQSIPGTGAIYLDGAFATATTSAQPRILILGACESGWTYELFQVTSQAAALSEFGIDAEVTKPLFEAQTQGADNVAIMRIGGRKGSLTITNGTESIVITPEHRDDTILDRYKLVLEDNTPIPADLAAYGAQRVLIYDTIDGAWVFDTNQTLVLDTGIVKVESNFPADESYTLGTQAGIDLDYVTAGPTGVPTLTECSVTGTVPLADYVVAGGAPGAVTGVTAVTGQDGANMTLVERYAALNEAYRLLDYRDADMIIPCETLLDARNVAPRQGGAAAAWNLLTPDASTNGNLITAAIGNSARQLNGATPLVAGSASDVLGFLWQYRYRGREYTFFFDTASFATAECIRHGELTGDDAPAAVITALVASATAANDHELREVNFAHQLASFCQHASTGWKTMLGFMGVTPPVSFDRPTVTAWAGELPSYEYVNTTLAISGVANNGDGLLGNVFLAGAAHASDGYRDAMLDNGAAGDGLAYGGLIKSTGATLPQGLPYGINDSDEATDANAKPIDIGKHIFICYDHPLLSPIGYPTTPYRGNLVATVAGKFAVTDEREEPIGINGAVARVSGGIRLLYPQINDLASIRMIGLRFEEGFGWILVSARTAAHPDSDYSRLSTIRSVNRELDGIRTLARSYIGKEFSSTRLLSLQASIDGYLKAEQSLGYNQGAVAALSYTRADKILGRLTIRLKMIPPFSIESITVEISLAAEEAELS